MVIDTYDLQFSVLSASSERGKMTIISGLKSIYKSIYYFHVFVFKT